MLLLTAALLFAFLPPSLPHLQEHAIHKNGIDVRYPEIADQPSFNAAVRRAVASLTKDFKDGQPKDSDAIPGYVQGSYTSAILNNGIVSILLDYSEYFPSAAHPFDAMASINYDTRTHLVLTLADLFQPGVDYLSQVSKLAIAALDQNEYADDHAIRVGAGPVKSNFAVFTLTDTALVLHFHMAQVAATAAGTPEAVIPLDKLTPMLRKR